jgi:hypothetical protein
MIEGVGDGDSFNYIESDLKWYVVRAEVREGDDPEVGYVSAEVVTESMDCISLDKVFFYQIKLKPLQ